MYFEIFLDVYGIFRNSSDNGFIMCFVIFYFCIFFNYFYILQQLGFFLLEFSKVMNEES